MSPSPRIFQCIELTSGQEEETRLQFITSIQEGLLQAAQVRMEKVKTLHTSQAESLQCPENLFPPSVSIQEQLQGHAYFG